MPAAEIGALTLQELHVFVGEDEGGVLPRFALKAHQALVAGLQIVAKPDPSDT